METFKTISGVPTKVICYGKHIDQDLSDVSFLILVIPGNPGIADYYQEFMAELYRNLNEKYPDALIPVWAISHAGHQQDELNKNLVPPLKGNEDLYSLDGQFNHKIEFTKTYIPSHIKVIGIGHSIGCKIWSEVIKRIDVARRENNAKNNGNVSATTDCGPQISKCFMLFPTMERMRATPNGRVGSSLFPYSAYIQPFLNLIMMLPTPFHKLFLKIYFIGKAVPSTVLDVTLNLFNPAIFYKVVHMARCELEQVWDLDVQTIKSNLDKLFFYFGTTDGWMPLEYVDDMKVKLPKMKYKICDKGMEHAFVIKDSVLMAETICSLIDITAL